MIASRAASSCPESPAAAAYDDGQITRAATGAALTPLTSTWVAGCPPSSNTTCAAVNTSAGPTSVPDPTDRPPDTSALISITRSGETPTMATKTPQPQGQSRSISRRVPPP